MIYRSERDQGKMAQEPYAGMFDFDGACAPSEKFDRIESSTTFTLGVFEWVKTSDGKGLKRSSVFRRFKGTHNQESVSQTYAAARNFCTTRNEQ